MLNEITFIQIINIIELIFIGFIAFQVMRFIKGKEKTENASKKMLRPHQNRFNVDMYQFLDLINKGRIDLWDSYINKKDDIIVGGYYENSSSIFLSFLATLRYEKQCLQNSNDTIISHDGFGIHIGDDSYRIYRLGDDFMLRIQDFMSYKPIRILELPYKEVIINKNI